MKNKYFKISTVSTVLMGLAVLSSCSDVLNEQPRSDYDPGFFESTTGVEGGLTALYSSLRDLYGNAYYFNYCETGTDEYTYAQSADGNFKDADLTSKGSIQAGTSRSDALWGTAFRYINSASGVIENGEKNNADVALISEAYFFRAYYYFQLVQAFGGVPLDLGAGELKFNTTTTRTSVRNTVPEVYTRAVFPDLEKAVANLPETPRLTGTATKNVAKLVLAQAYLTYAWWLENPNNIATYPECSRTDPDGHDAKYYFQKAYDTALEGIKNPGIYGLMDTYYETTSGEYDRNKEMMLYADHTETSEQYNQGSLTYGSGGAPDNFVSWMGCWNYTVMVCKKKDGSNMNPVQREAVQALGRPWTRMATPIDIFQNEFKDKVHDSRYDGTFTTRFHGNWNKGGIEDAEVVNANGMTVKPGDVILSFIDEPQGETINYPAISTDDQKKDGNPGEDGIGAGTLPGRADYVIGTEGISRLCYPMLYKQGPFRTDNGNTLGQPNAGSTRPFNILKFSEFYLVAAEAAVKGATTEANYSARDLVNTLRARAGKWVYNVNDNKPVSADYSKEMVDATPQVITIDYILDERMREYFGEGKRRFDLIRTQTWEDKAKTYRICGDKPGFHTPETHTRFIEKHLYLAPIPQGTLNALQMTPEEKAAYQNPGYDFK